RQGVPPAAELRCSPGSHWPLTMKVLARRGTAARSWMPLLAGVRRLHGDEESLLAARRRGRRRGYAHCSLHTTARRPWCSLHLLGSASLPAKCPTGRRSSRRR
ncbi:hypothetical protein Dimus_005213, partial [Dionaea muscipula]